MKHYKIPEATIMRLSLYSRVLERMEKHGISVTTSGELGDAVEINSGVVRKDLSMFGEFGVRGVGYHVRQLNDNIRKLLGQDRKWPVIIVGAGLLGSALVSYSGFYRRGFNVVGIVDCDTRKVDTEIQGKPVVSLEAAEKLISEHGVRMVILAVPAKVAQGLAQQLIVMGIEAILNFSPIMLKVPAKVQVQNVDMTMFFDLMRFTQNLPDNIRLRRA